MEVKNSCDLDAKIEKSLRYSVLDGLFYAIKVGLGNSFFSPFAILLGANNVQLGLLGTLPQIIGSFVQLFSHEFLLLFRSRKQFVSIGAFFQGAMLIPIALVFFLGDFRVYYLLFFISLYWIFGMVIGPIWNSWMGDLVPENGRGKYFGKRNKILGLASFLSMLAGGTLLHFFSNNGRAYLGFSTLFLLAFCARTVSSIFLRKKYDPEYKPSPDANIKFKAFVKQLKGNNYGKFVAFMGFMNFAIFFSAPFFAPYMLKDLQLDYMTFTIVNATSVVARFLVMTPWGQACDRFGTQKVLALTGFLMPLVPLLWIFCGQIWYLLLIQMYSGAVWAGFEIASFNYTFDIIDRSRRVVYMSYYNALTGIAILLGGVVGGLVVRYNQVFASKYLLVFLISGLLRLVISAIYLPRLKEARTVESISYPHLFWKIIATLPTMGFLQQALVLSKKKRGA